MFGELRNAYLDLLYSQLAQDRGRYSFATDCLIAEVKCIPAARICLPECYSGNYIKPWSENAIFMRFL